MLAKLGPLLSEALVLQDAQRALALGDAHVRRRQELPSALPHAHDAGGADGDKDRISLHAQDRVSTRGASRRAQRTRALRGGVRTSGFSHVCAQVRAAMTAALRAAEPRRVWEGREVLGRAACGSRRGACRACSTVAAGEVCIRGRAKTGPNAVSRPRLRRGAVQSSASGERPALQPRGRARQAAGADGTRTKAEAEIARA